MDLTAFLASATVSPSVFALRPDYRALLIAATGLSPPGPTSISSSAALSSAESFVRTHLLGPSSSSNPTSKPTPVTDLPHIAAWRAAYKAFGAKPNKTRNSLEALTRRITLLDAGDGEGEEARKQQLPRINALTDHYNALSVRHQIPLGGEDIDKYVGAPRCVRATGEEEFETTVNGEVVREKVDKGEVVWCDDAGVTCRRWNWRQGPRTALGEETTGVLFICDALGEGGCGEEELGRVGEELIEVLRGLGEGVRVEKRLIQKEE